MASVSKFLEVKLRLRVNREKFLGYRLLSDGRLGIAPKSLERAKDRIRAALSGKGWWRKSGTPAATQAMSNSWWETLGLVNLVGRYVSLPASCPGAGSDRK